MISSALGSALRASSAAAAIAERLTQAGIDYAIAGAIALGEHGFKRLTVDVDVLIRREGLDRFTAEWLGRGYVSLAMASPSRWPSQIHERPRSRAIDTGSSPSPGWLR